MVKKLALKLIRFYQIAISPYKGGKFCSYVPTCSEYAKEAIDMYGVLLGGWLALSRIIRCNPLNKKGYGFDPVPVGKYRTIINMKKSIKGHIKHFYRKRFNK